MLIFGGKSGKPWAFTAKGAKNAKDSNKNSLRPLRSGVEKYSATTQNTDDTDWMDLHRYEIREYP